MKQIKGRILCVDDDKDTREMLRALLGLEGYEVVEAKSVAEGLSQGVRNNFDLILLDWVFEDGTGVELCKRLRGTGAATPVLFCSGRSDKVDIETALKAGAQGFLIKPVDAAQLFDSLSQVLNAAESGA